MYRNGTVELSLREAFMTVVKLILRQKAEIFCELGNPGLYDTQKTAVTNWVVLAKTLRSSAERTDISDRTKRKPRLGSSKRGFAIVSDNNSECAQLPFLLGQGSVRQKQTTTGRYAHNLRAFMEVSVVLGALAGRGPAYRHCLPSSF